MKFEEVAENMTPKIAMLLNQLHIYKDHEEYTQVALIALWKAYENYVPGPYPFYAYLYNKMRFAMIDELRKNIKHEQRYGVTADEELGVLLQIKEKEEVESEIIAEMFKGLKNEEKTLLKLLFFEEQSNEALAKALQISEVALKKRKYRLLQKLKAKAPCFHSHDAQ